MTSSEFSFSTIPRSWSGRRATRPSRARKTASSSIKKNAPGASIVDLSKGEPGSGYRFEIVELKNGQFYARFVASNGEPMVVSETYPDKRNAVGCAESVAKNAPGAEITDEA